MSLTADDLKSIRKVIREEVESEMGSATNTLKGQILLTKATISNSLSKVEDKIKDVDIKIGKVHKDLKKEIKLVLNFLDQEDAAINNRVTKIEKHLNLPKTSLEI